MMLVLHSGDHLLHNPAAEYYDGIATPYAESPDRMVRISDACRGLGLTMREVGESASVADVTALHSEHYVDYLRDKCAPIPAGEQVMPSVFIGDTYTPLTNGTYRAALKSAAIALEGAEILLSGEGTSVYALCRPPGHHAEGDRMMGYCYFNNSALAAEKLAKGGRVAILDVDYHHGNGTQGMFYGRDDVLYVSLHADPSGAFPYGTGYVDETGVRKGLGFNRNFPLPPDTTPESYLRTLTSAVDIINDYNPSYVVLSLGYDTYKDDPIAGLGLDEETYSVMGRQLAESLAQPTLLVQEGGYNVEKLGSLVENFVAGYTKIR